MFIIILCGCYFLTKKTNLLTYCSYPVGLSKEQSPFMKLHISLLSQEKKIGPYTKPNEASPYTIKRRGGAVRTVTGTVWMTVFDFRQRIEVSVQDCDKTGREALASFHSLDYCDYLFGTYATWNVVTTSSEYVEPYLHSEASGFLGLRGTR